MSHEATNWAIKQRGLKPTTKIVLWHLCDRFNPDYGCFPSQDRLAHDCEISRSTLNDHLGQLEAVGLLRRVPRLDPVTKRQLPTRYILGFEPGFTPVAVVPCPEIGHGEDGGAEIHGLQHAGEDPIGKEQAVLRLGDFRVAAQDAFGEQEAHRFVPDQGEREGRGLMDVELKVEASAFDFGDADGDGRCAGVDGGTAAARLERQRSGSDCQWQRPACARGGRSVRACRVGLRPTESHRRLALPRCAHHRRPST